MRLLILLVAVPGCLLLGVVIALTRQQRTLFRWAARNRVRIISHRRCFMSNPFPTNPLEMATLTFRQQRKARPVVYKVNVRDEQGRVRAAWVRCGGPRGVNDDEVLVHWKPAACPKCGYDIEGLESDRCPECGTALSVAATR